MGAALFAIGTAAAVGGKLFAASEARSEADTQSRLLKEEARSSIVEANREKEATAREQLDLIRRGRAIKGTQIARGGASGATISSFLPVLIDTAEQLELERIRAKERGEGRELQFRRRSILSFAKAKSARQRGKAAFLSGLLGAGGSAALGASTFQTQFAG